MSEPLGQSAARVALRSALTAHLAQDHAEAERGYRAAIADPKTAERAAFHMARLMDDTGRHEAAVMLRRTLLQLAPANPDYRLALAQSLLALGRYEEAWPEYEARRDTKPLRGPQPQGREWDGGPVGSLVVLDEEGAGDAIQFLRFLPELTARGIDVTFVGRSGLVRLVEAMGVRAIRGEGLSRAPAADGWVMLCSLALRLGVTVETLSGAPYLTVPAERRELWDRRLQAPMRIGVVDAGNPGHPMNLHRSLPSEGRSFLASLPGAVSLAPDDFPAPLADFADTAAVIERLDLVIAVDTAVAHLAGALGKPCWLLLSSVFTDWRWMRKRTDTPWYASVRLYRQPSPGDWASVLRDVSRDLEARLEGG